MDARGTSDNFLFEPFRLDRRGLFRREEGGGFVPLNLGSRAADILRILVDRAGELVSKEEIIATVWPGTVVEDSNLTVQISALRRFLDERPAERSYIQTAPGRGYRFVATVTRLQPSGATESASEAMAGGLDLAFLDLGEQQVKNIARPFHVGRIALERTASPALPPLPEKPSIAVLPFQNLSGDPEQEYFVDGMVQEIITTLSHIRWLFVIARNSSFTYKGQAIDVKQVGRELGVRYVLEGSVRKAGRQVRITGQLIDAITGTHLWADRFDGSLEDVFELQDKIAVSDAGVIEPALQAAEMRRSAERPTSDLTAYDLYLRALAAYYPMTKELVFDGWAEEPGTSRRKGVDLARQALQAGENDPGILASAAQVLAQFGEDIGAMMGLVDRALALRPSFARGWFLSGLLRLFAGPPDLAIEHVETSLRLSPRERIGVPLFVVGTGYFFKRRFDEAAAKLLLSIQDYPGFPASYRALAACYGHMGR